MQGHNNASEKLSLQTLVNKIAQYSAVYARQAGTSVINSVHPGIFINPHSHRIIPLITELIETVVSNSKNSEICVSAERFREIVILQVQDMNNNNGYALGFSLQTMEQQATDAGAFIQFKDQQKRIATVSLSFSN